MSVVNVGKRPLYLRSLWLYMGKRARRWYNRALPSFVNEWLTPQYQLEPRLSEFLVTVQASFDRVQQPVPGTLEVGHEAVVVYSYDAVLAVIENGPRQFRKAFAVAHGTTDLAWSKGLSLKALRQQSAGTAEAAAARHVEEAGDREGPPSGWLTQ